MYRLALSFLALLLIAGLVFPEPRSAACPPAAAVTTTSANTAVTARTRTRTKLFQPVIRTRTVSRSTAAVAPVVTNTQLGFVPTAALVTGVAVAPAAVLPTTALAVTAGNIATGLPMPSTATREEINAAAGSPTNFNYAGGPAISYMQAPAISYMQAPAISYMQAPVISYMQAPVTTGLAITGVPAAMQTTTRTRTRTRSGLGLLPRL